MKPLRVISLRYWLPILVSLIFFLFVVFLVFVERASLESALINKSIEFITYDLNSLTQEMEYELVENDANSADRALSIRGLITEYETLIVVNEQGRIIFSTEQVWLEQTAATAIQSFESDRFDQIMEQRRADVHVSEDRQSITAYFPITLERRTDELRPLHTGVIYLHYDLSDDMDSIWSEVILSSGELFLLAFLGIISLLVVQRIYVSRPLQQLVITTRRIRDGELGAISNLFGKGELATLGQSIDYMSEQLRKDREILRRNELLHSQTSRIAKVGGWQLDADNLELSWTAETARLHELPPDHKPTLEEATNYYHPDDKPKIEAAIKAALEHGEPWDIELRLITAKGNQIWTHATGEAVIENGKVVKLSGVFQDISETRQALESLRQANLIVESSSVVLFRWQAVEGWPVEFVSENVTQFGYSAAELTSDGTPFSSIVHPDDLQRVGEEVEQHTAEGDAEFQQEYRLVSPQGEIYWIDDRTTIERDAEGNITHYTGIVVDITKRKKLERERNNLLLAMDQMAEAALVVDPDLTISYLNKAFYKLFGYNPEQIIGKSLSILNVPIQEKAKQPSSVVAQLKKEGSWQGEVNRLKENGESIPVYLNARATYDESNQLTGYIGSYFDLRDIKKAAHKLSYFSRIIENSLNEIYLFDPDTLRFIDVNRGARKNLGYSLTELKGMTPLDIKPEFTVESFKNIIKPLRTNPEEQLTFTTVHRRKDKSLYPVDIFLQLFDEEPPIFVAMILDITERKQAEAEASQRKIVLDSVFQVIPDLFFLLEPDGTVVEYQAAENADLYVPAETFMGKRIQDVLPAQVAQQFESNINIVNERGELVAFEYSLESSQQTRCWEARISRLPDGKQLVAIVRDITERKQQQEALSKNIKDLEDQKHVLDSHVSVSTTDLSGSIIYVNEKFCELSGYSEEELIGQNHRMLNSNFHPVEFFEQMWSTLTSGNIWKSEVRNKAKDGSYYWVESTLIPLFDENGVIQQYTSVRTDITSRKRAEEQLRQTQKLEAIGELTGGVAHDFNNLLGIILGNIKLVGRKIEPDSKTQRQLDRVAKAATRGVVLTRRMLKFSHQAPEQHSPLNINEVLDSMKDLISKSLTAMVKVEMSLAADLWMVDIDEGSFEDAMINLSLNASDAMAEGGELLFETKNMSLDRRSARREGSLNPGDYVCLEVRDTGTGMSAEILEKIFDPFFTTKDKSGGTGLGLAMVYGFIQRCNGHISVFSEPGKGSTFRIYLPRSHNGASQFKKSKLKQDTVTASLPRGTETVLIVDDEKDLTLIAEDILQELGYTTICASAGDEALHILQENHNIKLLFSDIVMPGMSGIALADAAISLYPELKILLTSGFMGTKRTQTDAESHGEVLLKPYDDLDLARRVRESLDGA